jgi:hypothetical protein
MIVVFYFPELFPERCVFCNYVCIQQMSFCVFLYIYALVRQVILFIWVHYYNYILLTASFSCTISYMQHDYYKRTSYQCVTSHAGSKLIVLRHPLKRGTELVVFVTNKWS